MVAEGWGRRPRSPHPGGGSPHRRARPPHLCSGRPGGRAARRAKAAPRPRPDPISEWGAGSVLAAPRRDPSVKRKADGQEHAGTRERHGSGVCVQVGALLAFLTPRCLQNPSRTRPRIHPPGRCEEGEIPSWEHGAGAPRARLVPATASLSREKVRGGQRPVPEGGKVVAPPSVHRWGGGKVLNCNSQ